MPLTPEDVVRKTFTSSWRGYTPTDVDNFLEEVVAELRRLQQQLDDLRATHSTPSGEAISDRFAIEASQLEQIRAERADLMQELIALQAEYDQLRREVATLRQAVEPEDAPRE